MCENRELVLLKVVTVALDIFFMQIIRGEDEELITVEPSDNTLNLVYRYRTSLQNICIVTPLLHIQHPKPTTKSVSLLKDIPCLKGRCYNIIGKRKRNFFCMLFKGTVL
jgi:hypothetical protein